MSFTFEDLRVLLDAREPEQVQELLRGASDAERELLRAPLCAYIAAVGGRRGGLPRDDLPAVCIAVAGCLATATEIAAFLSRRDVLGAPDSLPIALVSTVLRDRRLAAAVAARLAADLPDGGCDRRGWDLIRSLYQATRVPIPIGDALVADWVHSIDNRTVDRLRTDPLVALVAPRIFEVDGLGWWLPLVPYRDDPRHSLALALPLLAAEGRLDRLMLLDGCLSRFQRGEKAEHLRGFVAMYQALDPTPEEVAERVDSHLALLADPYGRVASAALAALRAADRAGLLASDVALRAGRVVLYRSEKQLVRGQVSWLKAVAKRHPDRLDDVCQVLALGFAHPAADVAGRALEATLRYVEQLRVDTRDVLRDAARSLPPQFHGQAAALRPARDRGAVDLEGPLVPAAPAPFPDPIASPAELAEELSAFGRGTGEPAALDRVLDGLIRFVHRDRDGLVRALGPVMRSLPEEYDRTAEPIGELLRPIVWQVCGEPQRAGWPAWGWWLMRPVPDLRGLREVPGPYRILAFRLTEIAMRLADRPVPALVATPTLHTGHIAPGALVDRLAAAERDGWQPWRYDLAQALLRLPPEIDGDAVSRAQRLTSPAGRLVAARLAAGAIPEVQAERMVRRRRPNDTPLGHSRWDLPPLRVQVRLAAPPDAEELVTHLADLAPGPWLSAYGGWEDAPAVWAMVAPSHRDAVAAWALPWLARLADQDWTGGAAVLLALAEASGPVGPGLTTALAYTLSAKHDADRAVAVDAFVALAAADDLPAAALGGELGFLTASGLVKSNRVVTALGDASRAGAAAYVWRVLAACLPAVLAADPVPRHTADLLALASESVARSGVPPAGERVDCAELARAAARPGRGRLATEARRLVELFRSAPTA